MRAKYVIESLNFERGLDPKEAMGTGFREIKLDDLFQPILKEYQDEYGNAISKKGITKYWHKFKNIIEPLILGKCIDGHVWKIGRGFEGGYDKKIIISKILNTEVIHLFRKVDNRSDYINVIDSIGDRYSLYFYITYKICGSIKENINFKRGLDPKEAMNIGRYSWHNGWRLVQEPIKQLTENERFIISDINWSRKPSEPSDVYTKTEVTQALGDILENLPIIDFKSYFSSKNNTGLFVYDEWPEDFPKYQYFVTNVEEEEGVTYLVNTEGSRYPRYMTQLV